MAVIVRNKTFPNACIGCDYKDCDFYDTAWNRVGESHINYTNSRVVNCPLKSVDGLIEFIKESKALRCMGATKQVFIEEKDLFRIIKEYCGGKE